MSDKTLREELFDTIHDKRVVLTWLEWENAVVDALSKVVERRVKSARRSGYAEGYSTGNRAGKMSFL